MLKVKKVNWNNFKDVPDPCMNCLYWQTTGSNAEEMLETEASKKARMAQ